MSQASPPERVLLILQAEGAGPELPVRLRRFLKAALRSWGLRCLWVQDATGWSFGEDPGQRHQQATGPGGP